MRLQCHCFVHRQADLETELERHLMTGKPADRAKLNFRCPVCRSAVVKPVVSFARAVVN